MESSAPSALWIALAAVASLVALVQTARIAWGRISRRWTVQARARRAVDGELRAEPMLRQAGYEEIDRQVRGGWTVYSDGEPLAIGLRADLLVMRRRDARRYVAEVKTGRLAPRLDHAATRRQLLEYRMAFGVDGVLLVDAEAGRVVVVEIGDQGTKGAADEALSSAWATALTLGVALGTVLGWFLHNR